MMSKRYVCLFSLVAGLLCGITAVNSFAAAVLMAEDFEGLTLGPFLDESLASVPALDNTKAWTSEPPANWSIDNSWLPAYGGVRDWYGWTFANVQAWAFVAGDQGRTGFTNAKGACAIADSDEWDDKTHEPGLYETYMTTSEISVSGLEANSLILTFDSSWLPEGLQDVNITVSFDGGEALEILYWNSTSGDPWFHDSNTNEFVTVQINNPADAKKMKLTFGYMNGSNNWFWAIDNIKLTSGNQVVFSEDFEGLTLGPFLDENLPADVQSMRADKVWTKTPPTGWVQDDSVMPAYGGVRDWWGWTFANALAWATVAGDQGRFGFAKAKGVAAIADSDEWDDLAHDPGNYEAYLSTPEISLVGMDANSVTLSFDSSWRPEGSQFSNITVSFDGAEPVEILYWSSVDSDPNFHPDTNTNESVSVSINNPAGAKKMVLKFGYGDASNNWFWAIDNLVISSSTFTGINDWQLF